MSSVAWFRSCCRQNHPLQGGIEKPRSLRRSLGGQARAPALKRRPLPSSQTPTSFSCRALSFFLHGTHGGVPHGSGRWNMTRKPIQTQHLESIVSLFRVVYLDSVPTSSQTQSYACLQHSLVQTSTQMPLHPHGLTQFFPNGSFRHFNKLPPHLRTMNRDVF